MASLSNAAVKRPITFLMGTLILIGFGIFGLTQLRLNLYPDVSFPTITVYTNYEGVAPEDMETLVTRPIEEAVGSISGIRRVRSLSSQGASVIKLTFNWGTDLYEAENDVRKELGFTSRALPNDAETPLVFSYDPNQEPVVVLTLRSEARSSRDLRTFARQILEQRIERVGGVASAQTLGGLERQINVQIDNQQMLRYNLNIATIANRLRQENIQVPAGQLVEGNTIYSLRTLGEFKNVDQIRNTVVAFRNGQPIKLDDVAKVQDGIAQPIGNVRINSEEGVIVNVYRQSDANVVSTAANVIAELDGIRQSLPADTRIDVLTNKADFIEQSISNLLMTGIQAIFLVILILLAFLRSGRSALIIAISIPISIITTFSVMNWADLSLNIISLSGLTLAVGLVVDDAVVVLENIFRFREQGVGREKASIDGAREVAVPVVVSTLTTLVVFLPILFVPGIAGFLFRDLALTISFSLAVSSVVALTLIPLMTSKFFKEGSTDFEAKNAIANWFSRNLDRLEKGYQSTLEKVIVKPALVVALAVAFFALTVPLFYQIGGEFFPRVDENAITLEVQREPGVNLFELERSFKQIEEVIKAEVPEARLMVSDYGDKEGIEGADKPGGYRGLVQIELVPQKDRDRSQFEITDDILQKLTVIAGVEIKEVVIDPLSPDGETGLIVQVYGYDPIVRQELSNGIKEKLASIEGISSVYASADEGRPELRLIMDRERIARLGMSTNDVATAIANAVRGNIATTFVDQGIEFEVLVELNPLDKSSFRDLTEIQIQTPDGVWMPLKNLARVERFTGPTNIMRIDQERVAEVTADLGDIDLKTATDQAKVLLAGISFPDGYRFELAGTAEEQSESFGFLIIAFAIAGLLTYMVMASQFESLVEPFIIIATIPLALSGVLIILWATGTSISVTSMVGLILLSGIVVNNGIVMIDYIKILQARGDSRKDAIVNGATRRLRPILMTAFTTILSMVPLALEIGSGSETWSPMARTVIGGLTMSTVLMLFVVPCLYMLINRTVENFGFDSVHKLDPLAEEA
jgi:HAE1 family hydrophobic/amphiphilic exporter-1